MTRNAPITVAIQIFSRLYLLLIVIPSAPPSRLCIVQLQAVIWAQSEVVRFVYYTFGAGGCLRYNLFLVCQPLGVITELLCMYETLQAVQSLSPERQPWTLLMPNWYNFELRFSWTVYVAASLFLVGSPHVFFHLLA